MGHKNERQNNQTSKTFKVADTVLLTVQLLAFILGFIFMVLAFLNTISSFVACIILILIALLVKIIRMLPIKNVARKIALSQIKFYTPYLLTIMECVFKYYSQPHNKSSELPNNLYLIFLIAKNIYISFHTHQKLTSFLQALAASCVLVGWVALAVYNLMTSVDQFDNKIQNDYKKDLVLLFLTTVIANGAMMMDLIFRPIQQMIKQKEQEEEQDQKTSKQSNGSKQKLSNKQDRKSYQSGDKETQRKLYQRQSIQFQSKKGKFDPQKKDRRTHTPVIRDSFDRSNQFANRLTNMGNNDSNKDPLISKDSNNFEKNSKNDNFIKRETFTVNESFDSSKQITQLKEFQKKEKKGKGYD